MATREQWQEILVRLDKLSRPLPFKAVVVNDVRLDFQSFPDASATKEMLFRELADDAGAMIGGGFDDWILQLWHSQLGKDGEYHVATANTGDVKVQIAWSTDDVVAASEILVRRLLKESPSLADMQADHEPAETEAGGAPRQRHTYETAIEDDADSFGFNERTLAAVATGHQLAVTNIAVNKELSLDEKMAQICVVHPSALKWLSPKWAEVLGKSDSRIRQKETWTRLKEQAKRMKDERSEFQPGQRRNGKRLTRD